MRLQNYRNKHTEMECLKSTLKNRILKAKNSVLGLFKAFKVLKVRELRDKKVKLKSKIEEQFSKLNPACGMLEIRNGEDL